MRQSNPPSLSLTGHWGLAVERAPTAEECGMHFCSHLAFFFVYSYSHSTYLDHGGVHYIRFSCPQSARGGSLQALRDVEWGETRAVWRVFSNRSPSDPHPNQADDPCPCGKDTNSSHHLLRDCTLLATHRARLLASTVGDIQNSDFITNPKNFLPLRLFLRATGLGHTKLLC